MRARLYVLAIFMALMPFLNPGWSVLYYEAGVLLLAAVALLQLSILFAKTGCRWKPCCSVLILRS